jgi:lipopolysaccharide biosynthesis glycosyltransferase
LLLIMIIVSAADERYAAHFAAMLHSAWTHNPAAEFFLLDCGIEPSSLAALTTYAVKRAIHLKVVKVDISLLHGLQTTKSWSIATYARLLIPDLLPDTVERVLYLDADCVVVSDLIALWQTDMGEVAIAGVADVAAGVLVAPVERQNGIEIDECEYVNGGVLLMNLIVWRRDKIAAAVTAFCKQCQPHFVDQTGINAACARKSMLLSKEWNLQLFGICGSFARSEYWLSPRIVHCTASQKPWDYSDVPFASIYLYHRNQTPFVIKRPRPYRSPLRRMINLLMGRRKYWHQLIIARRSRAFASAYFDRIASSRKPTLPATRPLSPRAC